MPNIFERVRNLMLRRAVACVDAQSGHFEHSLIIHNLKTKIYVGHMII